jgi:hypothetical protein
MVTPGNETLPDVAVEPTARARAAYFAKGAGQILETIESGVIDGIGVMGFARMAQTFSRVVTVFDAWVVDGIGNLAAGLVWALGIFVRRLQSGFVQGYLATAVAGMAAVLGYLILWAHHAAR